MRAVILLCLVGAALAVPRSNRIVGGEDTTIQQYPYMANMQFGWFGIIWFQACGGSLLTSNVVLSAAHCYYGDTEEHWRVILGSSVSSGADGTDFIVKELFIHEKYNSWTLDNDVALVRLTESATLGSTIGVARIAGATFHLPDNTPVKAIGWGALSSDGPPAEQLQHVQIYTINHQICAERYEKLQSQPGFENWPEITNGMLCAGVLDVGGRDACQGDSGGPLAYDGDIIVGVTSWGYDCAHEFYPGVNARVSFYSEWIVNNINRRI